jgi:hypothetical protein
MDTIKVKVEKNYGRSLIYPDCAVARAFTDLTNTKTLTKEHLKTIKALGYEVEVTQEPIVL